VGLCERSTRGHPRDPEQPPPSLACVRASARVSSRKQAQQKVPLPLPIIPLEAGTRESLSQKKKNEVVNLKLKVLKNDA